MNSSYQFIHHQMAQVKAGGWPVFFRKLRSSIKIILRKSLFVLGVIATAPLVLLIVILRPLIHVRFGTLRSERFGHFASDVEAYLCTRELELPSSRTFDIIGCPEPVCNNQLKKMWARTFRITPGNKIWSFMDQMCQIWTRGNTHHIKLAGRAEQIGLFQTTRQHIRLTEKEHQRGEILMEQLGLPKGASWVCIHNRDASFLGKTLPGNNWHYHDYRDFSVQTMVSAAEELTRRGYYVLRIGSVVAEPLTVSNPMIIDYPNHSARSDFADIYLMAECKFYLGSDSGIFAVPAMFRKPFAFINFPGLQVLFNTYYRNPTPFILKRLWHIENQRFLSLREMFESGLSEAFETHLCDRAGVELICNTQDEIRDLAIEVDDRLKGHWQPQPEDEALQQRFWDIFRYYVQSDHVGDIQARIGASFIRNNRWLLE